MNVTNKPILLVFVGNYLPGYKAGGILRITVNTVDHLCDEFEFKIATRDRDIGDNETYADIKINQWQKVGNADVFYLPPQSCSLKKILNLIKNTPHHVLYLNSFFDSFTIKILLNRMFHRSAFKNVIVAPWGEFGWASLKQKFFKKFVFMQIAKLIGLYKDVTWRASSKYEKLDIIKFMKIKSEDIIIVGDLPIKNIPSVAPDLSYTASMELESLKIIFLSRISREKNLDYALKVLKKIKTKIIFDIYGPAENMIYWKECQELISQLPANVTVNYRGRVDANHVISVFSRYDMFFFPTGGEAYGHVIAECLISGTPALISTETPWRNLEADCLGWDVDLAQIDLFVDIIEKFALLDNSERLRRRAVVQTKIIERLHDPVVLEENRQLFLGQLIH